QGMKMPMTGKPSNPAEKMTAAEEKKSGTAPSGEQLQSTHPTSYTCRMHPEVKSMKPGKCPKCGMTLVSKETVEKQKANDQAEPKPAAPQP
ncbi:MAG: heavy metal-binding domain-containing protein, partial [Chthoniobacterales bacterium]